MTVDRWKQDTNSNLLVFKSTCWCKVRKKCPARNWSPPLITRSKQHCKLELGWTPYRTYQHPNDQIKVSYVQVIKTYLYVVNQWRWCLSCLQLKDCEGISTWTGPTCTRCINCFWCTHKSYIFQTTTFISFFSDNFKKYKFINSKEFSFIEIVDYKREA